MSSKAKESGQRYRETSSQISLPPRLGVFLTEVTDIPDMDSALRKVLAEYLELKFKAIDAKIAHFEAKWGMSFADFADQCAEGKLEQDPHSYEVEKDFWEWEQAVTLKKHYESISVQW